MGGGRKKWLWKDNRRDLCGEESALHLHCGGGYMKSHMIKFHRTITYTCTYALMKVKPGESEEDGWIILMPMFWLCHSFATCSLWRVHKIFITFYNLMWSTLITKLKSNLKVSVDENDSTRIHSLFFKSKNNIGKLVFLFS